MSGTSVSTMEMACEEREDLAHLTPQQWSSPVCAVSGECDVVAHMIGYDELGPSL